MKTVKRILNCIPSKNTEKDWCLDHAMNAGIITSPLTPVPLIDLRETWWKVGDQAETGSCVGWASTDSVFRWHMVKAGKIKKTDKLSVRYVWMASKETDVFTQYPTSFIEGDGTSLKAALDIARKYGLVFEDVVPFDGSSMYKGDTTTFYALASKLKISSYFNLFSKNRSVDNVLQWKKWIEASGGPILTCLGVDKTWDEIKPDGILSKYQSNTIRGGHAVSIVGYNEIGLIIRNSWGADWGDKGFAYATPEYAKAAFTEAYGIQV